MMIIQKKHVEPMFIPKKCVKPECFPQKMVKTNVKPLFNPRKTHRKPMEKL